MGQKSKKLGLTTIIFISMILGGITGIIFHYFVPSGFIKDSLFINGIFYVIGNGFLRAMQMLVVPLVLCSLICGSMSIGDTKKLGKVGVKTVLFYLVTTALAITVAICVAKIINPGVGADISAIESAETTIADKTSIADTLLNIIPKNPIQSFGRRQYASNYIFCFDNWYHFSQIR